MKGMGSVFVKHQVISNDGLTSEQVVTRLYPVFHIPNLDVRLLLVGEFMFKHGSYIHGDINSIGIFNHHNQKMIECLKRNRSETVYWLTSNIEHSSPLRSIAGLTVHSVNYDTMHKRFAHPSKDVMSKVREHTLNFPKGLVIPKTVPICKGCAEGKMTSKSFPQSLTRAKKPFERIHSDLKSFPVDSYHRYKYFVSFLDDFSSHAWVVCLRTKDAAINALRNFAAMVHTQYDSKIVEWMSDAGGEYKSEEFNKELKDLGIKILQSVPHQPQQNGRAERLNRTIMEKSQAIRFDACIPPSWWEFSINHAVHLYNRTPVKRLEWKTPYELINGKVPDISHLRVFGCGAYVYIHEDIRVNKLAPRSEMMIFLGYPEGIKGYLFMRAPNNVLFTAATATFDETYFPKCPDAKHPRGPTQTGEEPDPSNDDGNIPNEGDDDDDIFRPPTPPNHTSQNGDGPDLENDQYAEEPADLELPNPPPEIMEEQPR